MILKIGSLIGVFCNKDINPKDMKQHIKRIHKIKPDDDDDENEKQ